MQTFLYIDLPTRAREYAISSYWRDILQDSQPLIGLDVQSLRDESLAPRVTIESIADMCLRVCSWRFNDSGERIA